MCEALASDGGPDVAGERLGRRTEALGLLAEMYASTGRTNEALTTLRQLAQLKSRDAAVWRRLGNAELGRGEYAQAVASLSRAIQCEPDNARAHNNLGQALMRLGRRAEAIASYQRATHLAPDHAGAHSNLGIALYEEGASEAALESYRRALELDPKLAEAHHNYGNALLRLERPAEALEHYDRAFELRPKSVDVLAGRGDALAKLQRLDEALTTYERALLLDPESARLLGRAASVLLELKRPSQALSYRERALRNGPQSAATHAARAQLLYMLGRFDESLKCSDQALALQPEFPQALLSRAIALRQLHFYEEALASCMRGLELDSNFVDLLCALAETQLAMGQQQAAGESLRRILELDPERADMRTLLLMNHIPQVPPDTAAVNASRVEFVDRLTEFGQWLESNPQVKPETVVGSATPFSLAYQEADNRDLLTRHGRLCCDLMSRWQLRERQTPPNALARVAKKARVAIVSAHIRDHSVYQAIVKGWLRKLDRRRLEVGVVHLGTHEDRDTLWARQHADFFLGGPRALREWVETLRGLDPEVLVFPEIGMHKLTLQLASLRLAPRQLAAWGHPETTGLPTIDYYLSAQSFEPPEAQDYYSEKLVPLPNLGCYYEPSGLSPARVDPGQWGIDVNRPMFICPGMPFKYAPQRDEIFTTIARRLGALPVRVFLGAHPAIVRESARAALGRLS